MYDAPEAASQIRVPRYATPEEQAAVERRAALYVAASARDAEDARTLLDACGLLPEPDAAPVPDSHGAAGYAAGCHCQFCRKGHTNAQYKQAARAQRKADTQ